MSVSIFHNDIYEPDRALEFDGEQRVASYRCHVNVMHLIHHTTHLLAMLGFYIIMQKYLFSMVSGIIVKKRVNSNYKTQPLFYLIPKQIKISVFLNNKATSRHFKTVVK